MKLFYHANRSPNMSHDDSHVFLEIKMDVGSSQYNSQPMGNDMMGSITKCMCVAAGAGLRDKFSNHSMLRTIMTNLVEANIASNLIL